MRISEERQAARLRITKLEIAIQAALDKFTKEDPNTTVAEIEMALVQRLSTFANHVVMSETPGPK